MTLPFADDLNYWKTSARRSADDWLTMTVDLIGALGGKVLAWGSGSEPETGRSAYMITFEIGGDHFRAIWPVLPTRSGKPADLKSARTQAATMLYHDTKAKCLKAVIFGARTAFFDYLMLPDGRSATSLTAPEIEATLPEMFKPPAQQRLMLPPGLEEEEE